MLAQIDQVEEHIGSWHGMRGLKLSAVHRLPRLELKRLGVDDGPDGNSIVAVLDEHFLHHIHA